VGADGVLDHSIWVRSPPPPPRLPWRAAALPERAKPRRGSRHSRTRCKRLRRGRGQRGAWRPTADA
jgi:hypothetical protein